MRVFRSIFQIINYKTFIITFLSVGVTWLCRHYNIVADLPLTLVGIAIVFPVVFSIDSAYKRRERSLELLSNFKAMVISIYHAARDWTTSDDPEFEEKVKAELHELYLRLRQLFVSKPEDAREKEKRIFAKISELSVLVQQFRKHGVEGGEMSRVSQYVSNLAICVESMKVILFYRTPVTLRAYSKVFIYSFPVLYGPYFVYASQTYSAGLEYMMPVVFSFILVSLDNIQEHLENPFDQIGEDDIKFDVEEFSEMIGE